MNSVSSNTYLRDDLHKGWDRCERCAANKAQLAFVAYMTRQLRVERRVVDGVVQATADVSLQDLRSHCYDAEYLCYACAARRYGGDYLAGIGLVDWTDDPADEPDPAPDWPNQEREAWLQARAERRELAGRRRDDLLYGADMFADAAPGQGPTPRTS
jgi:hypothetical protein